MTYGRVTAGAQNSVRPAMDGIGVNGLGDRLVAAPAGGFRDFQIECGDANVVRVRAGREVKRVKEAVAGFDGVFPDKIMGRVAIVTGSGGMMARFDPGVVLRAHRMAIGAGVGIIQEVGITLGINEGVRA